jgi:putative transcriptional regulator
MWYLHNMSADSPLRNRVKELRSRLGLRQTDLADEIGVTRQTIIAIEKGRLNPSIIVSLKVARVLREPVDYVFFLNRDTASEKRVHRPSSPTKTEAPRTQRVTGPPANAPVSIAPKPAKDTKGNPEQAIWEF